MNIKLCIRTTYSYGRISDFYVQCLITFSQKIVPLDELGQCMGSKGSIDKKQNHSIRSRLGRINSNSIKSGEQNNSYFFVFFYGFYFIFVKINSNVTQKCIQ